MWTHGEAGSSALLFQIIPFSSECSITLSFCPDLSSLPHRTLVSSWPLWGGSRITSRKAAGSHPGEVTLPKSLGRITDSLQRAVPTPSVMSKAIGPGSLAGTLLLMPTHKHPLLPWGFSQTASVPPLALPPGMVVTSPLCSAWAPGSHLGLCGLWGTVFVSRGGGGGRNASATARGDFMCHCCVCQEQLCLGGSLTIMTEI